MTLRRTALVIAAVWVAIVGALAWEGLSGQRAARRWALRSAQLSELNQRLNALRARGEAARQAGIALQAEIDRRRAAQGAASSGAAEPDFRAAVAGNPALRQLYLKGVVADVYRHWGLLFRQLGLSPDQIAQFVGLQSRLEETKLDLASLAASEGVTAADPAISAQLKQAEKDASQAIRELLGPENFAAYHGYDLDYAAVALVNDLPGFAAPDTAPLSDPQAEQLAQILADASAHRPNGRVVYGTVDWPAAMPVAQALLSADQFQALQVMESEKLIQWQKAIQLNGHP